MNNWPCVDPVLQSNQPAPNPSDVARAGESLPPKQVLGLLTLVASLKGIPSIPSGALTLENLIQSMKDCTHQQGGSTCLNTPVDAPVSEDFHPGHPGIDYAAAIGSPVITVMDGMVTFAGWDPNGYGNLIIVENGRIQAWYAHLSRFDATVGRLVRPGDLLGASGASGYVAGPHLHFEIRLDGIQIDPARFFDRGSMVDELR